MPRLSKNLKLIAAGAVASLLLSSPAAATVVDTALWTTLTSPGLQFNSGGSDTVTKSGTSVSVVGNRQSTVVSNFSQSGDFVFSGRMSAGPSDNDNMGVTFGFSDLSNHYRLGWEGGGFGDIGSGSLGASGANGLFLVVEQGGVGSVLFQNASLNWALNTDYDFTVSRTGNDISFTILQGLTVVESQTVTDTTFLSGQIGVYTESQAAEFSNLAHTDLSVVAVPEPNTLFVLGFALAGLGIARRRMR